MAKTEPLISVGEIHKKYGIPFSTIDSWRRGGTGGRCHRVTSPTIVTTITGRKINTSSRIVYRLADVEEIVRRRKHFGVTNASKWWEGRLPQGWEKLVVAAKRTGASDSTLRSAAEAGVIRSQVIDAYGTRYGKAVILWSRDVDKWAASRKVGSGRAAQPEPEKPRTLTSEVLERFALQPIDDEEVLQHRIMKMGFRKVDELRQTIGNFRLPSGV